MNAQVVAMAPDTNCFDTKAATAADSPVPWPLQTYLPLAALPTAPACARGHVRSVVHEWGLPQLADTAELLASELVTNSVQAYERYVPTSDAPVVAVTGLRIISDGVSMVIHVWDACAEMPARQDAGPDASGGRGLLLVETLGKDWGAYRQAEGKVVWVLISSPVDP
ncbi:MAG TPA: ATP-binding protein [Streptosporangiaceae bacterium]|nr:ATP-binding protein [Streptosporangiaceae bacterium]